MADNPEKVISGQCPQCRRSDWHYDTFEDMWTCLVCKIVYAPVEIGFTDLSNSPYLKLGISNG